MNHHFEAIAYHGWGFDARCWDAWKGLFDGIEFQVFDRGYFKAAQTPTVSDTKKTIVLAHSYGLHLYPIEWLQQVEVLVIFGGFIQFHPSDEREKRRSQRVLRQMIQECQRQPDVVLDAFRLNCDSSVVDRELLETLNHHLLVDDLQALDTACLEIAALSSIPTVVVFHGTDDRIVPVAKGRELQQCLQQPIHYFEVQAAGHALPFTHTPECWKLFCSSIDKTFV